MSEIALITDVLQTGGGYAFAAVLLVLYIKAQTYVKKLTADLVAHSQELGKSLEKMAGAAEASKETNTKLDALRQSTEDINHRLDLMARADGGTT